MVIGLLLIGVPIAVALGLSSTVFLLIYSDSSLASVAGTLFQAFEGHFTLLAIPFFILASSFMTTGGVARRIIRFLHRLCRALAGWSGDCGRLCLYAVCSAVRVVASNRCGHRDHRDRGHASGGLFQGIRRRRDL